MNSIFRKIIGQFQLFRFHIKKYGTNIFIRAKIYGGLNLARGKGTIISEASQVFVLGVLSIGNNVLLGRRNTTGANCVLSWAISIGNLCVVGGIPIHMLKKYISETKTWVYLK